MASAGSQRRPACITRKGVCKCTVYTVIKGKDCEECEHLAEFHLANQQPIRRSYEDEVHLEVSNSPMATIPRKDTVAKLHELMKKYPLIQIRATPGSGKTTLLKLLRAYCKSNESDFDVVCLLAGWPDKPPGDIGEWLEAFAARIGLGVTTVDLGTSQPDSKKIAILLDEGQHSYHDVHLWHTFIKTDLETRPNIRFVVASCYGSKSDGDYNENRGVPTSDFIDDERIVQLYASAPKPGVFFTKTEFAELENKFARSTALQLNGSFRKSLFSITGGHCGAVFDLLNYIFSTSEAKYAMLTKQRLSIFDVREMEGLEQIIMKMNFRRGLPNQRLPDKPEILHTEHVREVLHKIVSDGQMPVIAYKPQSAFHHAIRTCESKGWITKEMSGTSNRKFFAFPTGLHHWWFEYQFFKEAPPFPTAITLQELIFASMPGMSRNRLIRSEEVRASHSKPEATYQNEISRILFTHTAGAAVAAPEVFVGQGNRPGEKGRLDFLIKLLQGNRQQYWGVEVLIDEGGMQEHHDRFAPNGKYASARLDDFILLNFQKCPPKYSYPNVTKAWTIAFNSDFTKLDIYNATTGKFEVSYFTSP